MNKENQSKNLQINVDKDNKDIEKEEKSEEIKENIKDIINKSKENNRSKDNKIKINDYDKNINLEKPEKIYKYYSSKKIRNSLPHIISPQRLNYINNQQFSLNDIENVNIVPLVLPHIGKIKKDKNIKHETTKKIIRIKDLIKEK